ncbi:hypothetical protein HMPREF1139_0461 [Campylobacter sp. FOBRC14]|nr:hypothetical protein HMPREF1139_0461 [Campylobacter sp. FOBRC14]
MKIYAKYQESSSNFLKFFDGFYKDFINKWIFAYKNQSDKHLKFRSHRRKF